MKTAMLGLLAETPIHPGTGRGMGVVDLPVAREAATDYPVLVGSSLKGALKDKMKADKVDDPRARFGVQEHAGDLLVSDARVLLLPRAQPQRVVPLGNVSAPSSSVIAGISPGLISCHVRMSQT